MSAHSRTSLGDDERLTELIHELLDAHGDTARLASDLERDPRWGEHLAYLRDLQRVAFELLARRSGWLSWPTHMH